MWSRDRTFPTGKTRLGAAGKQQFRSRSVQATLLCSRVTPAAAANNIDQFNDGATSCQPSAHHRCEWMSSDVGQQQPAAAGRIERLDAGTTETAASAAAIVDGDAERAATAVPVSAASVTNDAAASKHDVTVYSSEFSYVAECDVRLQPQSSALKTLQWKGLAAATFRDTHFLITLQLASGV